MALGGRYILACLIFLVTVQLLLCSAECQTAGRFGENCQHQCNCNGTCDGTTGICPTHCTEGFQGPTCQKRNKALRKTTTSSSRFNSGWTADKAVDGDTRQDVYTNTCFVSAEGLSSNRWFVELGDVFPMDGIVIYYRTGFKHRFVNARILVANASGGEMLCATVKAEDGDCNTVFRYTCSSYGSKLIIRHDSPCGDCILEFCEVQVFVCTNGTYGQDCSGQCGHCSDGVDCHHVTGLCPNGICQPGYMGDKCEQNCISGTYGQGCSGQCGRCSDGANCHHVTGSCLSGSCQPGYRGDKCDEGLTTAVTERQCPAACQAPTATPASMDGLGVGIAIGVGSTLALGGVSLAAFCLGRRYQRGPGETRSSNPRRNTDQSQVTGDRVYYNSASRPEEAEGNGQYETLDAESREVKVTNDYVSIVSKDA